jgi:predicted chitinase
MPLSKPEHAAKYIQPLMAAMDANQINTPLRKAHFLAQLGHESASMAYAMVLGHA